MWALIVFIGGISLFIIVFLVIAFCYAHKDNKSKNRQDDKSKNQIMKQHPAETKRQDNNININEHTIQNEVTLKIKNYKCDNCSYCETTNNFFTRWCSYWNKMTFLTGGCTRETTVLDYDYDDDLDLFVADDDDEF